MTSMSAELWVLWTSEMLYNNAISEYERSLDGNSPALELAKQMLVFMVRGVFFRLCFPYAQFATRDLSADVLFPMVCKKFLSETCIIG